MFHVGRAHRTLVALLVTVLPSPLRTEIRAAEVRKIQLPTIGDLFARLAELSEKPVVVSSASPAQPRFPVRQERIDARAERPAFPDAIAVMTSSLRSTEAGDIRQALSDNGYLTEEVTLASGRQLVWLRPKDRFLGSSLAYSKDQWLVWTTTQQVGHPMRRAIAKETRYFRQGFGEETATEVFKMSGTYRRRVSAVLEDGTVILGSGGSHAVAAGKDGSHRPFASFGPETSVVRVFADGVLVHRVAGKGSRVEFVRMRDGVALGETVLVSDDVSALPSSRTPLLKDGRYIAWSNHVVDLDTGKRWKFSAAGPPIALGDDTVAYWGNVPAPGDKFRVAVRAYSLIDGAELPAHPEQRISILRDGIGYSIVTDSEDREFVIVRAHDLQAPDASGRKLLRFRLRGHETRSSGSVAPTLELDDGLAVFTGTDWSIISWLK